MVISRRGHLPLILLVTAALLLGLIRAAEAPSDQPHRPATAVRETQPNAFFDPSLFYPGLAAARKDETEEQGPLAGGVVPHHDLAADLLSGFFRLLEPHPPTTVIVVGPNHENRGQPIITGRRGWQTEFGVVEPDMDLVDGLERAGLAVVDDAALSTEHAIGTLMPYLKYHAPQARVVPVILHRGVPFQDLRRLADTLASHLGDGRMLIASVDFSHYLTRAQAEAKDEETLRAIRASDFTMLMRMGPDHLDSPGSLSVLMMAMEQLGANGPHLTGHTNSGVILQSDIVETTSYLTFTYLRP